jgi:thiol-disulfide isomerase/thioredoxin
MRLFFLKYLCWIIVLVIITNNVFAQGYVKLSGKIQHPVSDSITITYNDNRIAYYPKEFFAHVDKKGNFSFTIPAPEGYVQADMVHGRKIAEMMLHAGDSLYMVADAPNFDSNIHYKGRGSEVENFVSLHTIVKGRMNRYTLKLKAVINKEPTDFLKSIAQEKKAEIDFLNKNKSGLPRTFIKYWTAYYQYYNYFFMQQYPQVHEMIKLRRYTDTIPEANYTVIEEMPYAFDDTLLQAPSYLLYLTGVFDIKLKAAGYSFSGPGAVNKDEVEDSVYKLGYTLLPSKSAEYFIAQNIYGRARTQEPARTESQFATFKKHWPKSEYMPMLDKQITMAKKLSKGQPAPDIDIATGDGKHMKLSELKGKVVYLHFWASWCKQCVSEMNAESKIKMLFKNKPVAFVYVSIDNDTATDNKIIAKFNIDGIFSHADGGWNANEAQLYGVQGLPAYFLIDEEGKFGVQNAPSPMQGTQLTLEISKLMK